MILLIDGYNVLRGGGISREQSDREIRCFLRTVSAYAAKKCHEAIVVFDGGVSPHSKRSLEEGVTVIYAGYYQRADDEIMKLIPQYAPGNILVVSSDHEIENCAHNAGVVTIDAQSFRRLLNENVVASKNLSKGKAAGLRAARGQVQKLAGHQSSPEVDALMEKAAAKIMVKWDDVEPESKKKHENKKSKRERELERVIKKL